MTIMLPEKLIEVNPEVISISRAERGLGTRLYIVSLAIRVHIFRSLMPLLQPSIVLGRDSVWPELRYNLPWPMPVKLLPESLTLGLR